MQPAPAPPLPVLLVQAMRPAQWIKNGLLFAGLFFSGEILHLGASLRSLAAFGLFCAASGSIYILNDLIDLPRDRVNPRKLHRPIAAGRIAPPVAVAVAVALLVGALGGSFALSIPFAICTGAYLMLMLGYCAALKNVFLVDTLIIAMGFVIRAIAGVIALRTPARHVPLTDWFVVCVIFLSLFVALSKRRSELGRLSDDAAKFRPVLAAYTIELLDQLVGICAACAILSYTLYATNLPDPWMMLSTLPFVIFGLFRYMHLVYAGAGDAPEEALLRDLPLMICVILWISALGVVYLLPRTQLFL